MNLKGRPPVALWGDLVSPQHTFVSFMPDQSGKFPFFCPRWGKKIFQICRRQSSYETRFYPKEDQPLRARAVYTVATHLGSYSVGRT